MTTPQSALLVLLLASSAVANAEPAWVGCSGAALSVDFLVEPGKPEILEFVLLIDDQHQDSHNWTIRKQEIHTRDRMLRFETRARSAPHRDFFITIDDTAGKIDFGTHSPIQSLQMKCYWALPTEP